MELILGEEYFIRFCGDLIGEDIKASKPSPEWANIAFKRFGVFTETKEGTQLNMATAKCLGEGTINARMLYSNKTKVPNYSNFAVMCNDKPTIMGTSSNSLTRRIRDIKLPRVFVENKNDPRLTTDADIYKACTGALALRKACSLRREEPIMLFIDERGMNFDGPLCPP